MGVTASGLFVPTWRDVLDATQLVINLDDETHKIAMFTNNLTPNFSADTAYGVAPYNADEVSGTGYSVGGKLITSTTFTESPSGSLMWDCADISWTSSTITGARCGLIYADSSAGNEAIMLIDFEDDFDTINGTFQILVPSSGLWTWDLTP